MKGIGWKAAGGVWLWAAIWFVVQEGMKVALYALIASSGVNRLFSADLSSQDDDGSDRSRLADDGQRALLHAAKAASLKEPHAEDLPRMALLPRHRDDHGPPFDPELVRVLGAMRAHIESLERRIVDLDGLVVRLHSLPPGSCESGRHHHAISRRGVAAIPTEAAAAEEKKRDDRTCS